MGELFLTDFGPIDESAGGGASTAVDVTYDGAPGLTATDVEAALDELAGLVGGGATVTTPSSTTVHDGGDDFDPWPTPDKILILPYGTGTLDFVATAAYAETPRVVSTETIYVEYYPPPVSVGPGEIWEFGLQIGASRGVGPSGRMVVATLPFTLDGAGSVEAFQYPLFVDDANAINGYFEPVVAGLEPWVGLLVAQVLTTSADDQAVFGAGMYFGGTGTGVITFYGGATYSRRVA